MTFRFEFELHHDGLIMYYDSVFCQSVQCLFRVCVLRSVFI
jgi:hypothetical protein